MTVHEAKDKVETPPIDMPTYVFTAGTEASRSIPQYFDADTPDQNGSVKQAERYVKRLAKGLQMRGLKPNDKLLLFSSNDLYFPVLYWGVSAASCVFTGCTANLLPPELTPAERPRGKAGRRGSGQIARISQWRDLWVPEEDVKDWHWRKINTREEAMHITAVINYSSGTTGLPKGVEISHYDLVANNVQFHFKHMKDGSTPAGRERRKRIEANGHRWLADISMYHALGQSQFCMLAPLTGAKVYIMRRYTLAKYMLYNDIYRITRTTSVPAIMVTVAKSKAAPLYNWNSIEDIICGSSSLAQETKDAVQEFMRPGFLVRQGYGMTECTTGATNWEPDEVDDVGNSTGRLYPNMSGRVRPVGDCNFSHLGIKYPLGELLLAGPNIMRGYFKNGTATKKTIVEEDGKRWLCSGETLGTVMTRGGGILLIESR